METFCSGRLIEFSRGRLDVFTFHKKEARRPHCSVPARVSCSTRDGRGRTFAGTLAFQRAAPARGLRPRSAGRGGRSRLQLLFELGGTVNGC